MAGTKLVTTAVLLLLFWSTHQVIAQGPLTVSITVDRIDPPGFTPENRTEYRAASGPQVFNCTATGGTGDGPTYKWSSTCGDCVFRTTTDAVITRTALHSGDIGTHTCTATRGGETAMDSVVINIVGAGIHVFNGLPPIDSQPNNGLVRPIATPSTNPDQRRRLRFQCRSNSTMRNVGELIGPGGTAITSSESDVFEISTGSNGGELEVVNFVTARVLTSSEQGVYTCRIPLQSGVMKEINIGIYPTVFNSVPTITNPLEFTQGSPSSTLTCTSTTSIATNVTFMRDGNAINGIVRDGDSATVNGVTYQLSQTVTNRTQSTYDNVLTITEPLSSLAGSTFTCQVENALGPSQTSQSFQILVVEISVSYSPPPGFTPGPNEYRAASGPVVVTCTATGGSGSGDYDYVWTSTCSRRCDFQTTSTGVTSVISRTAIHSGDVGTHTCTASRGGYSASDSIVFNVVGAGIHVFHGASIGSQPNNGLAIFTNPENGFHIRFFCRSDSLTRNVGELIGLDGNTFSGNDYLAFDTPQRGGELRIVNTVGSEEPLPASEQGIYTCRIPLQSGEIVMVNIGVYPIAFNSGPTINDPPLFTPGPPSTITCISIDSPATTVTFMRGSTTVGPLRDGESVSVGGITYELAQRVINRRESTYENILTINDTLANLVDDNFTCTVANTLGMDTSPSITISGGGGGGSNGGAIAGGFIGALIAIVLVALIIILVTWLYRRREKVEKSYVPAPLVRENIDFTTGQELESIHYTKATDKVTAAKNVAPVIQEFPENDMTFLEGEGLFFAIQVAGIPTPSAVWYQDGKKLVSDYSLEIAAGGSLTIPSVEPRHSSSYKLVVTNQAGRMERTVKVTVLPEAEATPLTPHRQQVDMTPIPVAEFGKYVATNHSNNNRGFQDLYGALYHGYDRPVANAKSAKNKPFNRFANITVYDDSRISLQPLPGHSDCQREYINASYVDGYSIPKKYIATQGPLPKTNVDFWRLVWQERSPSIVMVTNLREGNKVKCEQYWPESGSKKFGPFQVTITDQQTFADYVIRTFSIQLTGSSERSLKVTQFHFTAWPDHGVPDYATSMLTFHRRVISQHVPSRGPLVVHCSAGVGRTGTFITIDCVLEHLQKEQVIDIFGTVNSIRNQRMNMVQNVEQFRFVHDAVLESVTCGDTQIAATNFGLAIRDLERRDPQTHLSGFESQFQVLHQVSPKPDEVRRDVGIRYYNMNRSMNYLPADQYRVVLKGEVPDYIHAVSANGYKQQKAFIITENPTERTSRNFWKMLYSRKCATIVMLSQLVENGQEVCYQYWPKSGVKQIEEFIVELLGEEKLEGFVLRTLSVLDTMSGKAQQITQFHIVNWAPNGHCSNLKTVTDIIEEVGKVQRKTGNHPIAIHCSDTVCRSGMFCSIATTIERCKTEGVVDVFQVVKALRVQKPGAVLTVAQYQHVFEAVLVFLDSFDTYANFQNI